MRPVMVPVDGMVHVIGAPENLQPEDIAEQVCKQLGHADAAALRCRKAVKDSVLVVRCPALRYWKSLGGHLVKILAEAGESSEVAARRSCQDAHLPDSFRDECYQLTYNEMHSVRAGLWRTLRPRHTNEDEDRYFDAVSELEDKLAMRGYAVYDGHIAHCPAKVHSIAKLLAQVRKGRPNEPIRRICEVGFNSGHSALAFLSGTTNATEVVSFEKGHSWTRPAAEIISEMYPGRLRVILGDSAHTVRKWAADNEGNNQCDVVFLDGLHEYEQVLSDLLAFEPLVPERHALLMDDFGCPQGYCASVRKAFYKMWGLGRVHEGQLVMTRDRTHLVADVDESNGAKDGAKEAAAGDWIVDDWLYEVVEDKSAVTASVPNGLLFARYSLDAVRDRTARAIESGSAHEVVVGGSAARETHVGMLSPEMAMQGYAANGYSQAYDRRSPV